jgi:DNA polymerase III epsilon subunit-like protein
LYLKIKFTTHIGKTLYYNDIPTLKYKAILIEEKANAIMFWKLIQDVNTNNSLIKAANDAIGRTN